MIATLKQSLMIALGWLCVLLGIAGLLLPLIPGMLFLAMALFLFARSSQRFHRMLMHNRWFGQDLQHWQDNKSIAPGAFRKATMLIVLSFSASIVLVQGRPGLQLFLVGCALIVVWLLWRLCEPGPTNPANQQSDRV
jgi:uncharacterized membrane protein YbaN (DUF454 family)